MARIDPAGTTAAIDAPATLNAASDAIVSGYQFLRYWVTYGVQLADYVLGFVPFGYAIADQVNIFYYNLILPISDSVVYQLVVPVVNDPLNLASYVNGLIAVGQTSVNAAINTGVAEFNYFFGWLIPPLPPLPLAATEATEATTLMTLKTAAVTDEPAAERAAEAANVDKHDASATDAGETVPPEPASAETPKDEVAPAEPVAAEPETETTTHYFWSKAHNFAINDPLVTQKQFEQTETIFGEDRDVLELQQARILESPKRGFVDIKADHAGLLMRRIIRQALDAERVSAKAS
jgi:hypothetical protein